MKIKNIIWDFDGTLFNTYPAMIKAFDLALKDFNVIEDRNVLEKRIKITVRGALEHYNQTYGIDGELLFEKFTEYDHKDDCFKLIMPFENAKATIEKLNDMGIKNFILTHRGDTTYRILKKFDMDDLFCDILTFDMGFKRKPDPDGFMQLLHKHDLDRNSTLAVGDRHIDMEAGKNAGLSTCFYTGNGIKYDGEQADYFIDELDHIFEVLSR